MWTFSVEKGVGVPVEQRARADLSLAELFSWDPHVSPVRLGCGLWNGHSQPDKHKPPPSPGSVYKAARGHPEKCMQRVSFR